MAFMRAAANFTRFMSSSTTHVAPHSPATNSLHDATPPRSAPLGPLPSYLQELCGHRQGIASQADVRTTSGTVPAQAANAVVLGLPVAQTTPPPIPLSCSLPRQAFIKDEPPLADTDSLLPTRKTSGSSSMDGAISGVSSPGASDVTTNDDAGSVAEPSLEGVPCTDLSAAEAAEQTQALEGYVIDDSRGKVLAFPSKFAKDADAPKENYKNLELTEGDLHVKYTGPGHSDEDAAAIRGNLPIPSRCGVYYFEVTVLSRGREGSMGVGLCEKSVALNRLPGWDPKSWGYHGDDGFSFESSGKGKPFGPTFTTGDTVGCCVNFRRRTIFFTKNGLDIGVAFRNITVHDGYYPVIGMGTPNEEFLANFGGKPFKFDIDSYVKDERASVWKDIVEYPLAQPPQFPDPPPLHAPALLRRTSRISQQYRIIDRLVLGYLRHNGHTASADAFSSTVLANEAPDGVFDLALGNQMDMDGANGLQASEPMACRRDIRRAILAGDIQLALDRLGEHFPTVLAENPQIKFALWCRRFVEHVAAAQQEAGGGGADGGAAQPLGMRDRKAIEMGRQLSDEFRQFSSPAVRIALDETFSVLAYAEPLATSPCAYLVAPTAREACCNLVDRAVLNQIGAMPDAALERILRQVFVLEDYLEEHSSCGVFLNVRKDCLIG
ncbi:hypothetical protein HK405_011874 [Cladochytrium tenue]|nr:hypothetical protein HK405_011874 [Cladochytrium tenue]